MLRLWFYHIWTLQLSHNTLCAGSTWLLLINWPVLWNASLSWSSGTCQVSSLTVTSSFGSQITQPAGVKPRSSHKACFLGNLDLLFFGTKSHALALSVKSGLNNFLKVSNLLNVGGLTVPGITVCSAICKKDQKTTMFLMTTFECSKTQIIFSSSCELVERLASHSSLQVSPSIHA